MALATKPSKSVYQRKSVKSKVIVEDGDYDIREDEEQQQKCEETLQLLVTAGYFRARIKGLSSFDKVVGGICWCIQGCNVDIDIDLLFQDNFNIGQKIGLTEKIVRVLKKMKCPHRIEPHQIQGSDFIHVFPVVQWLVKQAIASRDVRMKKMKQFAEMQFDKKHSFVGAAIESRAESAQKIQEILDHLRAAYRPQRRFRKPAAAKKADQETQVATTLLEYGRGAGYSSRDLDGEEGKEMTEKEEKMQNLMDTMAQSGRENQRNRTGRLAAGIVGSILGKNADEIKLTLDDYDRKHTDLLQAEERELLLTPEQHSKRLAAIAQQAEEQEKQLQKGLSDYTENQTSLQNISAEYTKLQEAESKLVAELEQLAALETDENKAAIDRLGELMALKEQLGNEENEFKAKCKTEMESMKKEIESLRSGDSMALKGQEAVEEQERAKQIAATTAKVEERLAKVRLQQAKKTREVHELQRRLEEAPSAWETQQYQRRFMELYEQVTATHQQTKQYYDLYNTLESTLGYLQKEVNLLNSIYENFETAMASTKGREQFLVQMEHIVEGVSRLKQMAEKRRETVKARRDNVNEEYMQLVERERRYFQQVKDFQEECKRHEQLMARAAQAGISV